VSDSLRANCSIYVQKRRQNVREPIWIQNGWNRIFLTRFVSTVVLMTLRSWRLRLRVSSNITSTTTVFVVLGAR
jgi:hypothetical protein